MESKAARVYQDFEPSMEWVPEDDSDTLLVYLPGFAKEQLRVQLRARNLILSGERKLHENTWSRFRVEFPVSANCDLNKISAKFEGNILFVRQPKMITPAPKPEEAKPAAVATPQKPVDAKPTAVATTPQKPVDAKPAAVATTPQKPVDAKPAAVATTPQKPVDVKPAAVATPQKPVEAKPAAVATPQKPVDAKPAAVATTPQKPVDAKPAAVATTPQKPVDIKPAAVATPQKSVEAKPAAVATPQKLVESNEDKKIIQKKEVVKDEDVPKRDVEERGEKSEAKCCVHENESKTKTSYLDKTILEKYKRAAGELAVKLKASGYGVNTIAILVVGIVVGIYVTIKSWTKA
ncbi:uncharacterized protein LOC143529698 [Bidens hawaiensis]|uniref:uncharacterized protein LOC143529698 n=1 Tax=Bidens hawaiensis TaxID=980011 RepID=UPI004049A52C